MRDESTVHNAGMDESDIQLRITLVKLESKTLSAYFTTAISEQTSRIGLLIRVVRGCVAFKHANVARNDDDPTV
jgi:hypothetical protein